MSLLHEMLQQLIANHIKEPTANTLYTRDAMSLVVRASNTNEINALLGASTLGIAAMIYSREDAEVIIENVLAKLKSDVIDFMLWEKAYLQDAAPRPDDAIN